MSRFVVDAASLDRIGHRLGVLHGRLLRVPGIVGGYDAAMLGGGYLESELNQFARQWHQELTTVAGEIDLMQMRLSDASAAYRRLEEPPRPHAHAASDTGSGTTVINPRPPAHRAPAGSGVGSGTTVIDGGSGQNRPVPDGHAGGSGSGTTVIDPSGAGHGSARAGSSVGQGSGTTVIDPGNGGGSAGQSSSGAGGSATTVIGGARQPVDAGAAAGGPSSPLLSGQNAATAGR